MPYIWLALSGLILLIALARVGSFSTKIGLLFVAGSFIAFTDLLAILFRLYEFQPGLLNAQVPDSRLGILLGDGIFVPMLVSTTVGMIPRRRHLGSLLVLITLLFIENQFLIGHLFIHIRWKLWVSAALFSVYLAALSAWADYFEYYGYSRLNRLVLTVTGLYYLWTGYSVLFSGVLNLFTLRAHLLTDPLLDNVLSGFLLRFVPFGAAGLLWVWNRWVDHPPYVALLIALFAAGLLLLQALGIWRGRAPWHPVVEAVVATLIVVAVGQVDRWFSAVGPGSHLRQRV